MNIPNNLKRYNLQSDNLDKLNFVIKIQHNDSRIGYQPFFILVQLIEAKKLKKLKEHLKKMKI